MARWVGGLVAAMILVLGTPAYAKPADAWPDGLHPDAVRAATVGAASITAGRAHSCAVTSVGAVHCWGSDSDGQLGDGDPLADTDRPAPVDAGSMSVVVQVDAGEEHTCALEYRGTVFCWGDNSSGQLGVGDVHDRPAPAAVTVPKLLVEVTSGENHSCAVDEDGTAWCWGRNDRGQLGTGGSSTADSPVRVSDATGLTDPVVDIAAGGDSTCAATADGVAWCWGAGDRGQAGDGNGADAARPVRVSAAGPLNNAKVRQVAVGKQQACAVAEDGKASCWGRTAAGVRNQPEAVGGPAFTQVTVGGEHVCGIDRTQGGWCWGAGGEGQLGDGGTADRVAPVKVLTGVRDLDAGDEHTCALDLRYVARCWGNGGSGRLGRGSGAGTRVPVKVVGLPRVPAAVTRVTVAAVDKGLRVSWRPSGDFGSGQFVSYLAVTSDFAAWCTVEAPGGSGCVLKGLKNGTKYDVAVLTYSTDGTSVSAFATGAPAAPATGPEFIYPAPGAGGGGLPQTDSPVLVLPTLAAGFLLIALGAGALAFLMFKRA